MRSVDQSRDLSRLLKPREFAGSKRKLNMNRKRNVLQQSLVKEGTVKKNGKPRETKWKQDHNEIKKGG